jgi:uncharacterized protein YegJ (DUF2314 family)
MSRIFFVIVTAFVVFVGNFVSAQSVVDKMKRDDLGFMRDEDPDMQRAFAKAREGLDQFLQTAKSPAPDLASFSVKVGIGDNKNTEYFWIGDFSEKDGQFTGKIKNIPRIVKSVALGQQYSFTRSQIVDWTYIDKSQRKMIGNYTMCALLKKEPSSEAEATRKKFKLDCEF